VLLLLIAAGIAVAATEDDTSALINDLPERVSFNDDIRPLFSTHCVSCHGGVQQASDLSQAIAKASAVP